MRKALIIILVLAVIGLGGCVAAIGLVGTAVEEAVDEETAKGITQKQYESIKTGDTRADVEAALGEPSDVQESEVAVGEGETLDSACIYYDQAGEFAGMYQFCFEDGTLTSKSSG